MNENIKDNNIYSQNKRNTKRKTLTFPGVYMSDSFLMRLHSTRKNGAGDAKYFHSIIWKSVEVNFHYPKRKYFRL